MNYYAQGGLANVAENLATRGRNGDTQLIHVSPKELHGLQALAEANGTTLTINPDTGLPEAFNFKKLIPMIAGAALTATGVGAPAAALMVGGGYGVATGSIKEGLMAGIGAYGGAGLTTGFSAAGAQTVGEQAAGTAFDESIKSQGLNAAEASMDIANPAAEQAAAQARAAVPTTPNFTNASEGLNQLGSKQGLTAAYQGMPTGTLPALGITALDAGQQQASSVPGYQEDEYDKRLKGYRLSSDYQPYQAPTPNPYYRPVYAADGGVMESYDDEAGNDMARGGIASLGGYSDGGRMLKGPGDGMSDSIPGIIGGKQPARLADGEFVVPADVVSHLGNGSTDAGAKKLYSMMDKVRHARTGKKKQAPQVNVDKYLPTGKASGGIAGYAEGGIAGYATGGEVTAAYKAIFGREPDAEGLKYWTDSGLSQNEIVRALETSPEAQANPNRSGGVYADKPFTDAQVAAYITDNKVSTPAEINYVQNMFGLSSDQISRAQNLISSKDASVAQATADYNQAVATNPAQKAQNAKDLVTQIFTQQLGRAPDAAGLEYWSGQLMSGKSPAAVATGINEAVEGQQMDIQSATSAFRQALGRNPDPEGLQYWMSVAQSKGLTANQLKNEITKAAIVEQTQKGIAPGTRFENLDLAALESDPYAGYYSDKSIYDIAPDAQNVSMIGNRQVQFTTPATRQAVVSKFIDGVFTTNPGVDIINEPHIEAAIKTARDNGTLSDAALNNIRSSLAPVNGVPKTAAETRAILATPQARVIVDNLYGQQIGEDASATKARLEADQRQAVLTGQNSNYYQSNRVLSDAYKAAGLTVPFNYANYQDVDTRDTTPNVVTPENLAQKQASLLNTLNRIGTYQPTYPTLNRRTTALPPSVRDPYSDEGLKTLYGEMMDQYGPPPASFINPATAVVNPYTYRPPPVNNLTLKTPVVDTTTPAPTPVTNYFTAPNGVLYASEAAYNAANPNTGGG